MSIAGWRKWSLAVIVTVGIFVAVCLDKTTFDAASDLIKWVIVTFCGANVIQRAVVSVAGKPTVTATISGGQNDKA